jgi:hypothetical protein
LCSAKFSNVEISEYPKHPKPLNQEVDHANHLFEMQKSLQCGFEQDSTRRNRHQMQGLWKFNPATSKCASNAACECPASTAAAHAAAQSGDYANHLSVLQPAIPNQP